MNSATIADSVDEHAAETPDRIALVSPDRSTRTYQDVSRHSRNLARSLARLGVTHGERVAAIVDDCSEYVELYIAAARLGAIVVPINTRLTSAEVSALVDDCSPRVIVWSSGHYDVVSRSLADSASVVIGPTPDNTPHGTRTFDSLVHEGEQLPDVSCTVHGEHAFILGYTSGTTGKPKGAVLTHQSVAAIAESNNNAYRLPERSVCALTGSMSFVATVPAHILTHLASAEAW